MTGNIYKFFSDSPHNIDALLESYLYFNSYENFNDPIEEVYVKNAIDRTLSPSDKNEIIKVHTYYLKGDKSIVSHFYLSQLERDMALISCEGMLTHEIQKEINDVRLCCFCFDNKGEPAWKNKLLWSHYSNGMRGFCIELNPKQMFESLEQLNGDIFSVSAVEYHSILKKVKSKDVIIDTIKLSRVEGYNGENSIANVFNKKSSEWEYENEVRMSTQSKRNKNLYSKDCVNRIIAGAKCPPTLLSKIEDFSSKNHIELKKIKISTSTFELSLS